MQEHNTPELFKKLMAKFGEDEWEIPLFCWKHCFKQHKKSLVGNPSSTKESVPWHNDGPTAESNSMSVMIID